MSESIWIVNYDVVCDGDDDDGCRWCVNRENSDEQETDGEIGSDGQVEYRGWD